MAESIKEIAEAKSFTSLQEKVEKLQEEFTVSFNFSIILIWINFLLFTLMSMSFINIKNRNYILTTCTFARNSSKIPKLKNR